MSDLAERHLVAVDEAPARLADIGAEQATIGAALLSAEVADQVTDIIGAGDFYHPAHATIWQTIVHALMTGQPTDPVTVITALAEAGTLTRVGGAPYVHTCVAAVPTPANGPWYARTVADYAQRRRIVELGVKVTQLGRDTLLSVDETINQVQALTHQATTGKDTGGVATVGDLIDPLLDELADAAAGNTRPGLSTGMGTLDDVIGGLLPGQLIIVAGRPGMGKSIVATDIARATSRRGHTALIRSLEMSRGEIMRRLVAAVANIDLSRLILGRLSRHELAAARGARDTIAAWPLLIDDAPQSDLASIRSQARRVQQQHDLAVLCVDYLQLMTAGGRRDNRTTEVGEISRGLKLLAKELAVPVVVPTQLNRNPEARADRRPQLSDLRESGSIEQDADVVILLHRDDYYDRESPRAGEADFIVAKNRNGPTDTVTVAAQLEYARFVDMEVA